MLYRQINTVEDFRRHKAEEETNLRAYRALVEGKGRVVQDPGGTMWRAYDRWGGDLGRFLSELEALRAVIHDRPTNAARWAGYS